MAGGNNALVKARDFAFEQVADLPVQHERRRAPMDRQRFEQLGELVAPIAPFVVIVEAEKRGQIFVGEPKSRELFDRLVLLYLAPSLRRGPQKTAAMNQKGVLRSEGSVHGLL